MCNFDKCLNKGIECHRCGFNIKVGNFYKPYEPTCPFGYKDCINDPAYIQFHYPDWYKSLYGELSPEEAVKECEKECYYDNEDK